MMTSTPLTDWLVTQATVLATNALYDDAALAELRNLADGDD
jgi:hypothetical protein